ncbi:MAG: hypothetical protein M3142_04595 [Bacteroidota bacterium]|nr:hypothetical protein [Bacteroidota bacterium]
MLYFTQNNIEIEYHPETGILEARWIKILQEEQLCALWDEILKCVAKHKIKFLIFDASHLDYIPFLHSDRSHSIFQKELPVTSLEKMAIILSEKVQNLTKIENLFWRYTNLASLNLKIKLFHHHYEAIHWLVEFKNGNFF